MDLKEKELYLAIIVAVVLFSIIIIYFITSLVLYQRKFIALQKERINAEVFTLENERRRVSAELHDGLGPLISSVKLYINSIDGDSDEDRKIIHKASVHIDDIMNNIRQISNNLLPNTLVRKGLDAAVIEFITKMNNHNGLYIEYSSENPVIPKEKEINIFRIIQEVVNNAIKHSGASKLHIQLSHEPEKLFLKASDNGKGFDFNVMKEKDDGLGLKNLESRVEILGGQLFFKNFKGQGISYIFEIPA